LPETDLASAALVAEKLRSSIGAQTVEVDGTNIAITVSIGVAVASLMTAVIAHSGLALAGELRAAIETALFPR
jgi:GGDEF domain-containing protein